MKKEVLKEHLKAQCTGRKNTVTGAVLAQAIHVNGNDLRRLVNRLRQEGVPIASSREGYYYAATAGEVYSTIRQLRRMVRGLESAISGLERALERFGEGDGPA